MLADVAVGIVAAMSVAMPAAIIAAVFAVAINPALKIVLITVYMAELITKLEKFKMISKFIARTSFARK